MPLIARRSRVQRQPPDELAARGAGRGDRLGPVVVVAQQPGVRAPKVRHDRAGERGDVDEPLGALLDRVGQAVGQDEPALGVGVVDLDRRAGFARRMSPGLASPARRQVLGRADRRAITRDGQAEPGDRADRLEHRGAARHVELHRRHLEAGLDRDAAGVERDRLADQPEHAGRWRRRARSAA